MKEFTAVRLIIEKHTRIDTQNSTFQVGISSLESNLFELVKYSKNTSPSFLQLAQKMVLALNIVLNSKEKPDIRARLAALKFQDTEVVAPYLESIYEISQIDGCRDIIREIQHSFAGHCIREAGTFLSETSRQLTLFQYSKQKDQAEIQKAEKLLSKANQNYEKVSDFCRKYQVS